MRTGSGDTPVESSIRYFGGAPGVVAWGWPVPRRMATAATITIRATAAAAASGASHRLHFRARPDRADLGVRADRAAIASPRPKMLSGVTAPASSR